MWRFRDRESVDEKEDEGRERQSRRARRDILGEGFILVCVGNVPGGRENADKYDSSDKAKRRCLDFWRGGKCSTVVAVEGNAPIG